MSPAHRGHVQRHHRGRAEPEVTPCPYCGQELEAHTLVGDDFREVGPEPGDVSLCLYCGGVLIFDQESEIRPPTGEELRRALDDPHIVGVLSGYVVGRWRKWWAERINEGGS